MSRIPDSVIEEIKSRCDIEDVISRYVTLKRAGSNMTGLCPFHSEKTPSFTVFRDTRTFYCFGCGSGGDVITFIMKAENLDYVEALEYLAKMAGISIPETQNYQNNSVRKQRIVEMNKEAAKFFHEQLKATPQALEYLKNRGLSTATIKHFGLGYAPSDFGALTSHMHKCGYTDEELIAAFLCGKNEKNGRGYDYFRNRIMFPIIDTSGDIIAFGGRIITDEKPKYLNTKDTTAFKKSKNLFALNFAKNNCRESLILCEGYMDVIALHASGITNAVATLGTALTEEQARIMKRCTNNVIISYDSDEAGQNAADRAFRVLREVGFAPHVLKMDGAKDPDEYIKKFGVAAFKKLLEGTYSEFDYKFENILSKNDISTTEGRINAGKETVKVIAGIYSSVEREIYLKKAASSLEMSYESLLSDVNKELKKKSGQAKREELEKIHRSIEGVGDRVNPDRMKNSGGAAAEDAIIGIMLNCPEYIDKIKNGKFELDSSSFITEFNKKLFEKMMSCENGFDIGVLNEDFAPDEVARVVELQAKRSNVANNDAAFSDCIKSLINAKSKNVSIEELLSLKRKAEKNNG